MFLFGIYSLSTFVGYIMPNLFLYKTAGEKSRQQLHKNAASNIEQVLAATPLKTPTIRPPASHHEMYPS